MKQEILEKLIALKRKYEPEGFIILGVFGSYARGEETAESDLDILYALGDMARRKYPGLRFVSLYERVRRDIAEQVAAEVDLADRDALHAVGQVHPPRGAVCLGVTAPAWSSFG
jgi:hypothetical protein